MRGGWVLLGLLACETDKDGAGSDDTGSAPPPCEVTAIDGFWPEDGQSPTTTGVVVQLDFAGVAALESSSFALLDAGGAEVAGALALVDEGATFTPDAPLSADTTYTWSAEICDATASGSFTTGAYGDAVDGAELVDLAFAIDLADAEWVQPEGGEDLFSSLFSGVILLGVEAADATMLDLIVAVGEVIDDETVQQDPCFATADFEPADFRNNPYAKVGPTTLEIDVEGLAVPLRNVRLEGAFIDGGASLEDGVLTAEGDIRDVASAIGSTAPQACELLTTYVGIECTTCTEDGEPYCVGLELHEVRGVVQPGITVVPNENPSECDTGGGA